MHLISRFGKDSWSFYLETQLLGMAHSKYAVLTKEIDPVIVDTIEIFEEISVKQKRIRAEPLSNI